ncbi:MAG: TIGR01841 family phasin [Pseudomonadota bacterium]
MATAEKTNFAEQATDAFESIMNFSPDTFKQGYEKFAENVTAFSDIHKESFEALVAANKAYVSGLEQLMTEQSAFLKDTFEDYASNAKSMTAAGGVQNALETNSEFVRTRTEKNMKQASKIAEICMTATQETVAPLSERYSELVEKIQSYRP